MTDLPRKRLGLSAFIFFIHHNPMELVHPLSVTQTQSRLSTLAWLSPLPLPLPSSWPPWCPCACSSWAWSPASGTCRWAWSFCGGCTACMLDGELAMSSCCRPAVAATADSQGCMGLPGMGSAGKCMQGRCCVGICKRSARRIHRCLAPTRYLPSCSATHLLTGLWPVPATDHLLDLP